MFRKYMLLSLFAVAAAAQTPTLSIPSPPGQVTVGSTIILAVNFSGSAGSNEAALQWSLNGILWGSWKAVITAGPAATAVGKGVQCGANGSVLTCLLDGLNANLLGDGQIASIQLTVPANTPVGTITVNWSGLVAATAGGSAGPVVSAGPFLLSVSNNPCDISGNGIVNGNDRLLLLGQIFGPGFVVFGTSLTLAACTTGDLNHDGVCNALDLQILDNAIVSGTCGVM